MEFEFAVAGRLFFGPGSLQKVGTLAFSLGRRALILTGRKGTRNEQVRALLEAVGVTTAFLGIPGEPSVEMVSQGVEVGRDFCCDVVLGIGGGSVLDAGKAIAALLTNPGTPLDYLEVIGAGKSLVVPSLPYIAIPTTAGTGTEVTRNAVLTSPVHGVKASIRSPWMLPRVALVDPELTYDLPAELTAASGMDALAQVIEPLVSIKAQPLTDALCRQALPRAARSLRRVFLNGKDFSAREDICFLSLCGGIALANAGLGAIHGFAAPLGGMFHAPHGALCACLLPAVVEANIHALHASNSKTDALHRYTEIASLLTGNPEASPFEAIHWLKETRSLLQIPPLRHYGVESRHIPEIVTKAAVTSSMKGNPIPLDPSTMFQILEQVL